MNRDLQKWNPGKKIGCFLNLKGPDGPRKHLGSLTCRDDIRAIKNQKDLGSNQSLPLISCEALVKGYVILTIHDVQTHHVIQRIKETVKHLAQALNCGSAYSKYRIDNTGKSLFIKLFEQ